MFWKEYRLGREHTAPFSRAKAIKLRLHFRLRRSKFLYFGYLYMNIMTKMPYNYFERHSGSDAAKSQV